jgi:hypothetical protein
MAESKQASDPNPSKVNTDDPKEAQKNAEKAAKLREEGAAKLAEADSLSNDVFAAHAAESDGASSLPEFSTYEENPNPNPRGEIPAPGPSTIQRPGEADNKTQPGDHQIERALREGRG